MVIHDFSKSSMMSVLGSEWRAVSDQVMGGASQPDLCFTIQAGRPCIRLTGDVSLENNGGFIQASLDLANTSETFDASDYQGIRLTVYGNDERYSVHLRTADTERPWQSYRAEFAARRHWQIVDLPFAGFTPHRLDDPLNVSRLRRLGIVAIGCTFSADLAVAKIGLMAKKVTSSA